jgi:hypothetical protein
MWLLALTFLPFLSLFQSARMLREVVVTMDTAEAFMDLPSILAQQQQQQHHRYHSQHVQDLSSRRRRLDRNTSITIVRSFKSLSTKSSYRYFTLRSTYRLDMETLSMESTLQVNDYTE